MYEMIRGQIEHEDSLINHRVTWLLAANAFLLAEYGLIHVMGLAREYLDRYEVVTPGVANGQVVLHQSISPDAVHLLELAICFIGFCTTFNIACSLLGAFDSLRDLQKKWGDCVGQITALNSAFPPIMHIGRWWETALGSMAVCQYC